MNADGLDEAEVEESKKDYSHLLQVFNIYKSKENFQASGFFNGGLDTGIEPSLLAVEFDTKENLADRLMTPFPTTSSVLPPKAHLKDHEDYTKQLMYLTLQAGTSSSQAGQTTNGNNSVNAQGNMGGLSQSSNSVATGQQQSVSGIISQQ